MCFLVPLPSSFWKPFLGEKCLLGPLNDANNQTCQTHISLIIVITLFGSHLPWKICIPTSMCCFFADDPPIITWAHNAGGGVRAQLYHMSYMELVGAAIFSSSLAKHQENLIYFWGYLKINAKNEGFCIYRVCFYFQFIKWGSLARSYMSNTVPGSIFLHWK